MQVSFAISLLSRRKNEKYLQNHVGCVRNYCNLSRLNVLFLWSHDQGNLFTTFTNDSSPILGI